MKRWGTRTLTVSFYIFAGAAVLLVGACASIAYNPMLTLGVIGAVLATMVFWMVPTDRIAGFSGSAAVVILVLIPVQNIAAYGNLKYITLGAVAALVVITWARRFRSLAGRPKGLWLFLVYFGLLAAATPRSIEPSSFSLLLGVVIAGLGPALLFAMMNRAERKGSINFVVALAALEAAYSLFELATHPSPIWGYASVTASGDPSIMYNQIVSGLIRSQGTLAHPLPLALLLLVALALLVRGAGPKNGLLKVCTGVLLFAGCFAAGSRSALAVATVLVFLGVGKRLWKALVVGIPLLTIVVLIAICAGFLESDVYRRFIESSSLSHRGGAVDAVPGLLHNQDLLATVFGNGYFSAYQLFRAGLLQVGDFFAVDNQFVMTLAEGGLITLAVLVTLILLALKRIHRSYRLGLLSVVVFFVSFDVLSWPSGIALFGVFLGLAFSAPAVSSPVLAAAETSDLVPAKFGSPTEDGSGYPAEVPVRTT
ncbi:hypothetical protein [Arthrobacter sp. NPDC058127]|uniref:hypothetical protein n=1 Tax=Arthrobacter sp. NPDC058127 TaxID=3346351 RepID=UPI0036E4B1BE